MRFIAATLSIFLLGGGVEATAQSTADCDGMLNKKITGSGTILKVVEMEMFIDALSFRDTKTGCLMVAIEALLDAACKPGSAIVITGTLTKSSLGYEIDRGENPSANTLACR